MRAVLVAGARPNFMKVAPVLWALEAAGAEVVLVHTGQHYDEKMSDVFFSDLGLRSPDVNLGVGSGTQAHQTAAVMTAFESLVGELAPDVVVVFGDVNSTVACGLVTAKSGARLAHVEAGLRSRDWAMPEEVNRVVTDRLSDYLLAPSADACANLRAEGYRDDQISLVGNVMVDTLVGNLDRARERPILDDLGLPRGGYVLVTLHRPSNVDDPERLAAISSALVDLADELPVVFPAHPRTRAQLPAEGLGALRIIEPCGYLDFVALEDSAAVVLTDSGGVQEETTMLGVPCLTFRDSTERPITVTEGSNRVMGTDPGDIVPAVRAALSLPREFPVPELWDGRAGERIARVLVDAHGRNRPRPTDLAGEA